MMEIFKNQLQAKINYKNFAEEVSVVSESPAGTNVSLYSVTNKNNITFQGVPGMPFQRGTVRMGYVNGDRARPVVIGSSDISTAMRSSSAQFAPDDISPGNPNTPSTSTPPSWPVIDVTPPVVWDIQLYISAGVGCDDTSTQEAAVTAI